MLRTHCFPSDYLHTFKKGGNHGKLCYSVMQTGPEAPKGRKFVLRMKHDFLILFPEAYKRIYAGRISRRTRKILTE